jgi:hypothetical protein
MQNKGVRPNAKEMGSNPNAEMKRQGKCIHTTQTQMTRKHFVWFAWVGF